MKRRCSGKVHNQIFYANIHSWQPENYKFLVETIEKKRVHTVRLLGAEEYWFPPLYYSLETFRVFLGFCKAYKVKVEILTGCNLSKLFNYRYELISQHHSASPRHVRKLDSWETFFAYQTVKIGLQENLYPLGHNKIITKHFVTLNHLPYYHRCMFLDHMYKEDLFENGYISFHIYENMDSGYRYKYWSPKEMKFDKSFNPTPDGGVTDLKRPIQFQDALFSVVCESTVDVQFITEKTYVAIWNRRPFLIYGHPKANEYLESLGFELFHECIDYSFDSIDDDEERCIGYMKQVKNLCKYDVNELKAELMPKVHRNWLNLIEIISNKETHTKIMKYLPIKTNVDYIENYRSYLDIVNVGYYKRTLKSLKKQYQNSI